MIKIEYDKKISPFNYVHSGWHQERNTLVLANHNSATISINMPAGKKLYLGAEVSLQSAKEDIPQLISISVNDTPVGKWSISSATIHDKLVIIPATLISSNTTATLSFRPPPLPAGRTDTPVPGIQLHSITVSETLDAYMDELNAGYNWVCGIRDNLIATIRKVIFYLEDAGLEYKEISEHLQNILQDPFIIEKHQEKVIFNDEYFNSHFEALKEGTIHQEIRLWMQKLRKLEDAVIEVGNHVTRRSDLDCFSAKKLTELIGVVPEYSAKIAQLRILNETLNNLEIILNKTQLDSVPSTLYLDITNTCNFRCRMCYQSKSNFLQTSLINPHMAEVIKLMPYFQNITVAGLGEPLLGRNLDIFSSSARQLNCTTCIITNGSLIDKNLDALTKFSKVSISFDGATARTFETLRHRSKFPQIISNIKKLRQLAPKLLIAFSVVVSRANIDEIADITKLAAELKINEINMTPMEHIEELKLRASDKSLFDTELVAAEKIAKNSGISLSNSVIPAVFSLAKDTPRNKEKLLKFVTSLATREEQTYNLEALTDKLKKLPFHYFPAPIVFQRTAPPTPRIEQPIQQPPPLEPIKHEHFDLQKEMDRLTECTESLLEEIIKCKITSFTLPYCLDPWKLAYVKSNGKSRLCCHADVFTGNFGDEGGTSSINSSEYKKIRHSMFNREKLLPTCRQCNAADRFMQFNSLKKTCEQYKIDCPNHTPLTNA